MNIEIVATAELKAAAHAEVVQLCSAAYDEPFADILTAVGPGVHVLGRLDGQLVAHAMWVTRSLQPQGRPPLRTAYVEAVATRPAQQRRGFASALLVRLAHEIGDHDLAALSPSDEGFYARLGWQRWSGPLFIRRDEGLAATPDDVVMILRLPRTPADLDLTVALSAEWRAGELW
jgi:aminoglycoside 2'-N-acetyltransferase I